MSLRIDISKNILVTSLRMDMRYFRKDIKYFRINILRYCIFSAMFVDIADNHSVVDRVKLSYIYDDVDNEEVIYIY
jgi:hypothetical protein